MPSINFEVRNALEKQRALKEITQIKKKQDAKEKKLRAQGYRWFPVSDNSKLFIPCNAKGNPTKEGKQRIQEFLEKMQTSMSIV